MSRPPASSSSTSASSSSTSASSSSTSASSSSVSEVKTPLTTNQGLPMSDDLNSLKIGPRGPSILEDFHMREKITHFDHERIPERVVHARGAGYHGFFECLEPAGDITKASIFASAGKKTPVFVRFSTVAGSKGSKDTPRDVRGFAIKFYTDTGVWDLVGNNMPVFFIQDAIQFPDLVHALKPEPITDVPQAASAHNTFWDYVSLTPESTHMLMWLMSDRALPRSFSMMEGFGVNTFKFVNKDGAAVHVKFHLKPTKGVHSLVWDEAQLIGGKDPDFNRVDLYDLIERKDFPEWSLGVQVIDSEMEKKLGFDILDPTKIVPEEICPVRTLGRVSLNGINENFFGESEQVAFCPAHLIGGIDFSDDPLLQGRLFSYLDTQISRLGVNFAQIPINRPKCPFANNQREGKMRVIVDKGNVAYFPSSLEGENPPKPDPSRPSAFATSPSVVSGAKLRVRSETFADHFSQATLFWNSLAGWERTHIIEAFAFELNSCSSQEVKDRVINKLLVNVHPDLVTEVAQRVGVKITVTPPTPHNRSSPALSMNTPVKNIKGRRIAVLFAEGGSVDDVRTVNDMFGREGVTVEVVGLERKEGTPVQVRIENTFSGKYDALFIADKTSFKYAKLPIFHDFVAKFASHFKAIVLSGDDGSLLKASGVDYEKVKQLDFKETGVYAAGKTGADAAGILKGLLGTHRYYQRDIY